jgi:hypothetical protein
MQAIIVQSLHRDKSPHPFDLFQNSILAQTHHSAGTRVCSEHFQQTRPFGLDRSLRHIDLPCDQFVGQARRRQFQDAALPRSEFGKASSKVVQFLLVALMLTELTLGELQELRDQF